MNGAKLTATDTVIDSPTVNLLLNESLRVMAGGLIQGKWINISAGDIEVEASGNINAEKRGYAARSGPGLSSGRSTAVVYVYYMFAICMYRENTMALLTAALLYLQDNLPFVSSTFPSEFISVRKRAVQNGKCEVIKLHVMAAIQLMSMRLRNNK